VTPSEPDLPILDRALEMAQTGLFVTLSDLEAALVAEGYPEGSGDLKPAAIRQRLRQVCVEARRAPPAA